MSGISYNHLQVKTEYSIARGTIFYDEAPKLAIAAGMDCLGVCDDFNMFGSFEFAKACISAKIKPIIGCKIKLRHEKQEGFLNLFAQNDEGYKNLLWISSMISIDKSFDRALPFELLKDKSSGIIALSASVKGHVGKNLLKEDNEIAFNIAKELREIFGDNFYLELTRTNLKNEAIIEEKIFDIAKNLSIPICAGHEIYFKTEEDFEAHDILTCVGEGRYVAEQDRDVSSKQEFFKTKEQMLQAFADVPSVLENTFYISRRCSVYPLGRKPMLPPFKTESGLSEDDELKIQAQQGLKKRIEHSGLAEGFTQEDYTKRLEYELEVILKMGFAGYFLIVSDFIKWSKTNNVPVGPGRGSGAGSIIAWVLYITDLDPLYYGLLFERFLNPERVSMPDFDIDFCQEKRNMPIEYVKNKYGEGNVASIITFGKLQARAALKDVGRVLQLSYNEVDRICKLVPFNPVDPVTLQKAIDMDKTLQEQIQNDENIKKLTTIALKVEGLNRHMSTHAAGIIIGDKNLIEIVPLYRGDEDDMSAVGYHMKPAESIGLVKFDFLGLKTLTVIANTIKFIKEQCGDEVDISRINMHDQKVFTLLQNGFTRGVFQLDSVVCRSAMRQMHIDKIEDVIALTSLNRPGPMENIPSYINRKLGKEKIEYPHPILAEVLNETYGIIIYQEQVMRVAQVLALYSLGQADLLRRAMGKKIKEEMDQQRAIFVDGCSRNNISKEKANEIFDLIAKFAGYGFNKSHAAAYSVISYQTAYLKAHYPLEFLTACLNMDIDNDKDLNIFIAEARDMGIEVVLPNVNYSEARFAIKDNKIVYGLAGIKAVGIASMQELVRIREESGQFKSIFDFCSKLGGRVANKRAIEHLAKAGAFDFIHPNRKQIIDNMEKLVGLAASSQKIKESCAESLFGDDSDGESGNNTIVLPKTEDYNEMEKLSAEFEAFGFYLSSHPIKPFIDSLNNIGVTWSSELAKITPSENRNRSIKMAGVVNIVKQRSGKSGRFAFVHISDTQGIYECMMFNGDLIVQKKDLVNEGALVGIEVIVEKKTEDETPRLSIKDIFDIKEFIAKPPRTNLTGNKFDYKNKQGDKQYDNKQSEALKSQTQNLTKPKPAELKPAANKPSLPQQEECYTRDCNSVTPSPQSKKHLYQNQLIYIDDTQNIENVKSEISQMLSKTSKPLYVSYKGLVLYIKP
jgi:DNA polymerase III subunit alpha